MGGLGPTKLISPLSEWLDNPYFDEETKKELISIENNEKEIEDRFYKNLESGTIRSGNKYISLAIIFKYGGKLIYKHRAAISD